VSELFWFHELADQGKGPDWLFNAAFAPGSHSALAAAVRAHAPPGFSYYHATQGPCSIHFGSCDYDLYIDTPHYQACVDQIEGRSGQNLYVYHSIQVCQDAFQLERGYGGTGQHGGAETELIRAIAQAPELSMASWSIMYGGATYQYERLADGTSSAALLAYLDNQ
jgi:hypothetical protein